MPWLQPDSNPAKIPHLSEPKPWHVVKMVITYIIYISKKQ